MNCLEKLVDWIDDGKKMNKKSWPAGFVQPPDTFGRPVRVWLVLTICLISACSGTETEFDRTLSPDGAFELVVTVTEPALPHARHVIKVIVYDVASETAYPVAREKMENDGVPFTARNIGLRWTGKTAALVCLRPTDIADLGIRISTQGAPSATISPGC